MTSALVLANLQSIAYCFHVMQTPKVEGRSGLKAITEHRFLGLSYKYANLNE
jgi:hypothetical protein